MYKKSHHSLNHLQLSICKELRKFQLQKKGHKKSSSSFSINSIQKSSKEMNKSAANFYLFGKQSSQKKNLNINIKQEAKIYDRIPMARMQEKEQKLKKKGLRRPKQNLLGSEMSFASTKCNDSKVYDRNSRTFSQLVKQNSEYQRIISNQKLLIQNLQQIIDQM